MIQWRIYYADYSTFDSSQGEAWEAPKIRAVRITQRNPDKRELPYFQAGKLDYFLWQPEDSLWYQKDWSGLMTYLFIDPCWPKVALCGEMVSNKIWHDLQEIAKHDIDFFDG